MITVRFNVRGASLEALTGAADAQLLAFGGTRWTYEMEVYVSRYDAAGGVVEWSADITAEMAPAS